jgi:hypothetical protein
VGGRGQGRQPPEAVARSASLEAGRTQVYENTVAPRRRIPFASVIGELTVLRARSGSQRLRRFDASHGRQDHTVLPYASVPLVCRAADRSQAKARPAIPQRSGRCRVHRIPCPTSVTIAIRPSWRAGNGRSSRTDLGVARRDLFSRRGLDGANQVDRAGKIRLFAHCGTRSPPIVVHREYALGQPDCIFRLGEPCSLTRNSAWLAGAKA